LIESPDNANVQRALSQVASVRMPDTPRSMGRTEARKIVHHFFTRLSMALVTLLPSLDSNFSGRLSNPKQCFQVSLSTS
jgi:hypothetical protein